MKDRTFYKTKGRWVFFSMWNARGYLNLGVTLYIRSGGFKVGVDLVIAHASVMYVSPKSEGWLKRQLKAALKYEASP